MRKTLLVAALAGVAGLAWVVGQRQSTAAEAQTMLLSHDVYFSLTDPSPENRAKLLEGCKKYLTNHPGVVFFAAGVLSQDLNREVNDRDFDVALHMVFKDKAAHDTYQDSPRHVEFVEGYKPMFKKVRVFDSYVEQGK